MFFWLVLLSFCFCFSAPSLLTHKDFFKEHHFITLMNLVGFSRRGCLPVMQRQMPPVSPQVLLMFKVMQRDGLIKRRLRDALGPSLGPPWRIGDKRSRMVLLRDGGGRMKTTCHPSHPNFPMHRHTCTKQEPACLLSPCSLTPKFSWIYGHTGVYTETLLMGFYQDRNSHAILIKHKATKLGKSTWGDETV